MPQNVEVCPHATTEDDDTVAETSPCFKQSVSYVSLCDLFLGITNVSTNVANFKWISVFWSSKVNKISSLR